MALVQGGVAVAAALGPATLGPAPAHWPSAPQAPVRQLRVAPEMAAQVSLF